MNVMQLYITLKSVKKITGTISVVPRTGRMQYYMPDIYAVVSVSVFLHTPCRMLRRTVKIQHIKVTSELSVLCMHLVMAVDRKLIRHVEHFSID